METSLKLQAVKREKSGTGSSRELRRNGRIPAIIYGAAKEEIKIDLSQKDVFQAIQAGDFLSRVIEIELDGKPVTVLPQDVQLHPVKDFPLHADFLRVEGETEVRVSVGINFINADRAPGIKRGGVLNVVRRRIEIFCKASEIPHSLTIDLEGKQIGESVHFHELDLPEGSRPTIKDRDFTIATITGRKAQEEKVEAAAGEEGEASEGDEKAEESAEK